MRTGARAIAILMLLAAAAAGQAPPGGAAMPMPPAPPDTAVARFSWSGEPPRALTVWPDEALFGQEVIAILDHAPGASPPPVDSLRVDVPWLEPVAEAGAVGELPLPPPEGPRQYARYRIYREGPWRAAWDDREPGPVATVTGRVDDPRAIEPVRDPRPIGGVPLWVVILAAGVLTLLAIALLFRRWRRRRVALAIAHRQLAPPAWIEAAIRLRSLEQEALLDRDHLDAVARVLRRYLHGRFFIAAEEMTADEVRAAARRAGWAGETLDRFADLLAACDDARYAPDLIGSRRLRDCLATTLDLIEAVRIEPIWTPVPASELAEAKAAWSWLRERYPATAAARGVRC
ncbi:hypothetical protein GF314_11510 [bacterium]|nr:hypothetical protein [bacterium]